MANNNQLLYTVRPSETFCTLNYLNVRYIRLFYYITIIDYYIVLLLYILQIYVKNNKMATEI